MITHLKKKHNLVCRWVCGHTNETFICLAFALYDIPTFLKRAHWPHAFYSQACRCEHVANVCSLSLWLPGEKAAPAVCKERGVLDGEDVACCSRLTMAGHGQWPDILFNLNLFFPGSWSWPCSGTSGALFHSVLADFTDHLLGILARNLAR